MASLSTKRLLLRPWCDQDLRPFADLNADPQVMRHFPAALSRLESDAFASRIRARLTADGFGLWAVEQKAGASFIGFIGLAQPAFSAPFTPCIEIGWRLSSSHWGQGLATEGALAAMQYGFTALGLDEIVSFTSMRNLASRRVMEKLRMQRGESDDFDHPGLPEGHALRRHVLYRLARVLPGTPESIQAETIVSGIKAKITLPVQVDDTTRLDDIRATSTTEIGYFLSLTTVTNGQLSDGALGQKLERNLRAGACQNADYIALFKAGFSLRVVYTTLEHAEVVQVVIAPGDCGF